ncbi:hypothetical protein DID88_006351 [Monilinia fructigena]|uniref:Uncharacterized protein n=1 Tax=Monilinia fructigena TaxID=38457 RepID=A0A395J2C7_9HELO|nr:hypothetical protein DID88_006351 [Monilinia fructigena]
MIENRGIYPYPSFNTIISASLNPISVSKSPHGIVTTAESTSSKYAVGTIHYPSAIDLILNVRRSARVACGSIVLFSKSKLRGVVKKKLFFCSPWYLHLRQEY